MPGSITTGSVPTKTSGCISLLSTQEVVAEHPSPPTCQPFSETRFPHSPFVSSGLTEISDGVEVSDEFSVCSDSSYDTYGNSTTTPVGPRGSGSRAKPLTDRCGR
jgi:hypothetical protein